jgi:hypothetical protein
MPEKTIFIGKIANNFAFHSVPGGPAPAAVAPLPHRP